MASAKKVQIEDDVDDLDDVLEQFNAPSTSTSKPTGQTKRDEPSAKGEEIDEEDFAKQFAAEMEAFMKGLVDPDSKPSAEPVDPEAAKQAEALRRAWEQLLVEDLEGEEEDERMATPAVASGSNRATQSAESSNESKSKVEDEFQNAVKQAMEKLKKSDDSSKAEAAEGDLAGLLSAFGGLNFGGDGGNDVQGVLESLMGQLMSKEVLYEPLKELHQKFPEYLEANRAIMSTEDQVRYDKQYSIVGQVVEIFETPGYSDSNQATTTEIVSLMSEMQEYGSPPAEIMGALPPGFDLGADGMPALGDNCIIA